MNLKYERNNANEELEAASLVNSLLKVPSQGSSRACSPKPQAFQMSERSSDRFTARRNSNIIDLKQIKINNRRRSSVQPRVDLAFSTIPNLLDKADAAQPSFYDRLSYQECILFAQIIFYIMTFKYFELFYLNISLIN